MLVERSPHSGAWNISEIVDGYLIRRSYLDYTKKEAIREFKAEMKEAKKKTLQEEWIEGDTSQSNFHGRTW
jgi:hypothetical protein